jgi:hypothetical protein
MFRREVQSANGVRKFQFMISLYRLYVAYMYPSPNSLVREMASVPHHFQIYMLIAIVWYICGARASGAVHHMDASRRSPRASLL